MAAAGAAAPGRPRGVRRCRRRHQRGLTLVETIVAVAVITVGVVGIGSSLAAIERVAGINQNQSQLELTMRQLSDWMRNSSSLTCTSAAGACPSLPYVMCATDPSTYNASVRNGELSGALNSSIGAAPVQSVRVSTGANRSGSTGTVTIPALQTCSASSGDWGVQEITLKVSAGGNTVTRVVWKSISW